MAHHERQRDQLHQVPQESTSPNTVLEPPSLEGRIRKEEIDNYTIFITDSCPPEIAELLLKVRTKEEVEALKKTFYRIGKPSRRSIYATRELVVADRYAAIFKQKAVKPNDPEYPGLQIEKFTTDVFHEMQAAYALDEIVRRRQADLPQSITYEEKQYALEYHTQMPWGALIDRENADEHYGIFECIAGTSARFEATSYGHWNYVPEVLRKFYGQLHMTLDQVANISVEEGLEPWDLGVHQLIYTIDEANRRIKVGIVDTEEFNFTADGEFWPSSFTRIGLPPILMLTLMISSGDYD